MWWGRLLLVNNPLLVLLMTGGEWGVAIGMLKDGVAQSTQCDVVEDWTLNKSVLLLRWCSLVHIIFLGFVVWTCDIRINPKILL